MGEYRYKLLALSHKGEDRTKRHQERVRRKADKAQRKAHKRLLKDVKRMSKCAAKEGFTYLYLSEVEGGEDIRRQTTMTIGEPILRSEKHRAIPVATELGLDLYIYQDSLIFSWGPGKDGWEPVTE